MKHYTLFYNVTLISIDMVTASTSTDSATVNWRIPSFTTQEEYYVLYGTDPTDLDRRTARISSSAVTSLTNQMFSLLIDGLDPGTVYYLRVVAVFDVLSKRESETIVIWTKENGNILSMKRHV